MHHLYLTTLKSLHIESENEDNESEIVPKTTASSPSKTAKITSMDNENKDVDTFQEPLKSRYNSGNFTPIHLDSPCTKNLAFDLTTLKSEDENNESETVLNTTLYSASKNATITSLDDGDNNVDQPQKPFESI